MPRVMELPSQPRHEIPCGVLIARPTQDSDETRPAYLQFMPEIGS